MFSVRNMFLFILSVSFISIINFTNSYCMEKAEQGGCEESMSLNGNSLGPINDIERVETYSQSYLINQDGKIPYFPKKFKNKNITQVHTAAYFDAENWLRANCFNKSELEIENFLCVFDDNKNTPMHFAARKLSLNSTKFLLETKYNNFLLFNRFDENIIIVALKHADNKQENSNKLCLEFLKLILKHCADDNEQDLLLNSCDVSGCTPLYWAVKNWDIEVVRFLLERGVAANVVQETDINVAPAPKIKQPLHEAIKKQNIEVVKLLLNYHADLGFKEDGKNALALAESLPNKKIMNLIWNKIVKTGKAWPYYNDSDESECVIV